MGLSDKELRDLLPSDKEIEKLEFINETPEERELINLIYATKKYSDILGGSFIFRNRHYTKMVKWVVHKFISKYKKNDVKK